MRLTGALWLGKLWGRLGVSAARHLCGIRLLTLGLEHLPTGGPALIAAQHQSAYDTMVFMNLTARPAYVLKRELSRIPLFGPLVVLAGMIAVDREGGATALRGLLRATDAAAADGRQLVIFPEGTRVDPGQIVKLQTGVAAIAARTGLPIIPAVTDSGLRWSRRAFRKHPGPVHVLLLPPIPAGLARPRHDGGAHPGLRRGLGTPGGDAGLKAWTRRPETITLGHQTSASLRGAGAPAQ